VKSIALRAMGVLFIIENKPMRFNIMKRYRPMEGLSAKSETLLLSLCVQTHAVEMATGA
jgi:hypothetical protein